MLTALATPKAFCHWVLCQTLNIPDQPLRDIVLLSVCICACVCMWEFVCACMYTYVCLHVCVWLSVASNILSNSGVVFAMLRTQMHEYMYIQKYTFCLEVRLLKVKSFHICHAYSVFYCCVHISLIRYIQLKEERLNPNVLKKDSDLHAFCFASVS